MNARYAIKTIFSFLFLVLALFTVISPANAQDWDYEDRTLTLLLTEDTEFGANDLTIRNW